MNYNIKNKQSGFLKLIIFIIIALFLMKYFKISISDVIDWVKILFNSVF
ncbi:MAG: hypothetical protein AAB913_02150 [Patescibacteria group bacterium]